MNERDLSPRESDERALLVLEEAETLIWSLLDEQLDETSAARLGELLDRHQAVRRRYIDCVQLHIDLQEHFAAAGPTRAGSAGTPILSNLTLGSTPNAGTPVVE